MITLTAVGIASAVAGFFIGILTNWVTRKGQVEAARDRQREEIMTNVRWAVQLALSRDGSTVNLGRVALDSVISSCDLMSSPGRELKLAMVDGIDQTRAVQDASESSPVFTRPDAQVQPLRDPYAAGRRSLEELLAAWEKLRRHNLLD
jgi:hypothetical protein